MATADMMLVPNSWVERLDPLTCSRADMETFRLSAWCLDPTLIPRDVDFHIVDPNVTPSAMTMSVPASVMTLT